MANVQKTSLNTWRRRSLLAWYDQHRRNLAWRSPLLVTPDPYEVWLSEIMLQQTTAPHATPYFLSFRERWPTVGSLAEAVDSDVMAAWAGLGYYARARNLLACARIVANDHGGQFPTSEAELRRLPGVGDYTAAAIAAIAFDRAANVVDGNVERVISRLFAVETPLPLARPELKRLASTMVSDERPGDWAQALMDLGSTVCRPRSPGCPVCPLAETCVGRLKAPERYPRRSPKVERPIRHGAIYVLRRGSVVAVEQRPSRGLLGGMLGLPTSPWTDQPLPPCEVVTHAPLAATWRLIGKVDHIFTHFSLRATVHEADCVVTPEQPSLLWIELGDAAQRLPSVFRKALKSGAEKVRAHPGS